MTDEEVEVLTGNVTVTVYDSNNNPVKKALVALIDEDDTRIIGTTNTIGECLFENVTYDTYTLFITKSNYESYTNNLTVDDETITTTITLTHKPVDPNVIEVDMDEVYTFTITRQVKPDYSFTTDLITWLQTNMESLVDDYDKPIFGKVNTGFNEQSLKTFGKKPVCDVYINKVEYTGDFDDHIPTSVRTIVLFYMKGANNHTYSQACLLHDLIMQKLITDDGFRRLDNIVSNTYITNSELRVQPMQKKWGVIGAFELTHTLY